jgi:Rod binding domain-containing protein
MLNPIAATGPITAPAAKTDPQEEALWQVSKDLEATFLKEMLKSAGLGETRSSFGGGSGEEQFSSFMLERQADMMVEAGGIGLAEHLFRSLQERAQDDA